MDVRTGDGADLPFPDAAFDAVVCFTMLLHVRDTMVVVDPATLPGRLRAAGLADPRVDSVPRAFRFRAVAPAVNTPPAGPDVH